MTRLVALCERYGEAIAADLALLGWDLVELFEAGRWSFVLNLIDHLPTGHYREALLQDEEYAETIADLPRSKPETPIHQWTPEMATMALLVDRLGDVVTAVVKAAGGQIGPIPRYPRPVTAVDKARNRKARESVEAMAAKLFPDS